MLCWDGYFKGPAGEDIYGCGGSYHDLWAKDQHYTEAGLSDKKLV